MTGAADMARPGRWVRVGDSGAAFLQGYIAGALAARDTTEVGILEQLGELIRDAALQHPTSDSAPPPAAADGGSDRLSAAAPGAGGPAGGGLQSGGHSSPAVDPMPFRVTLSCLFCDATTEVCADYQYRTARQASLEVRDAYLRHARNCRGAKAPEPPSTEPPGWHRIGDNGLGI